MIPSSLSCVYSISQCLVFGDRQLLSKAFGFFIWSTARSQTVSLTRPNIDLGTISVTEQIIWPIIGSVVHCQRFEPFYARRPFKRHTVSDEYLKVGTIK